MIIPDGSLDATVAHHAAAVLGRAFRVAGVRCTAKVTLIKLAHTEVVKLVCRWVAR